MKILFHLNSMGHGGAERVVSILSHYFAENGNDVVIVTLWYSDGEYNQDERVKRRNIDLTKKELRKNRIYRVYKRWSLFKKVIREEKPDIVISFCNKANFRSAIGLLGMSIPLIVSVRNDPQVDYAPYKAATKFMEYKAAGCVFQTPYAQSFFSKRLQSKSRVIFNPLAEEYLERKAESNTRQVKQEIVTVGRISKQKNHMLLVSAFADICEKYPNYLLKIYGDTNDEPDVYESLKKYIQSQGMQDRILFMGCSNSIRQEIENAALFVLPSDYEGMPNALIEAMVLGLPCIATDCPCGGSAMLIENSKSGLLVPVGDKNALRDAMDYMLQNKERAEEMGQEARKVIDKVHPDKICEEWTDFIRKILSPCL